MDLSTLIVTLIAALGVAFLGAVALLACAMRGFVNPEAEHGELNAELLS